MQAVLHVGDEMSTTNGNGRSETLVSTAHGAAARCLARAVAVAFDACEQSDVPLSELQKVAVIESALLEFDGFGSHLTSLVPLSRLLSDLRSGPLHAA
jgi:hypothetical protein